MSDSIKQLNELLSAYKTLEKAQQAFLAETGHKLALSSISRAKKGEAKPALIAFMIYAFKNIQDKEKA
ncbi:hypothetical protein [Photobacterium leiognathi]|uniref:hypothetical protein n=1 Tax=Photobacterium leiognathi TaxID=553611 RepID=UPI0029826E91|nr:hypothetical protein [Photobacterium leiognathi]